MILSRRLTLGRTLRQATGVLAAVVLIAAMPLAHAQLDDEDEIETSFQTPSAEEVRTLREILNQPPPRDSGGARRGPQQARAQQVLAEHFQKQELAARRLGDAASLEHVIREAAQWVATAEYKSKLASILLGRGETDAGLAMRRQAAEAANPFLRTSMLAQLICDLGNRGRAAEARNLTSEVENRIQEAQPLAKLPQQVNHLIRAAGRMAHCQAEIERGLAHHGAAIAFADAAVAKGKLAMESMQALPNRAQQINTQKDLGEFMHGRVNAYLAAGRLHDADLALGEYLRFGAQSRLPADFQVRILARAASVRLGQRAFAAAERLSRRADDVAAGLGRDALHPWRIGFTRYTIEALIGQARWADALAELDRLDRAAGENPDAQRRAAIPLQRGLTLLGNGRAADAAPWFARVAQRAQAQYGAGHFHVAEATGLRGAALWRTGGGVNRQQALPLLKAAVHDYMAPANADYQENIGIRHEVRALVFAAYLEALATSPGEDAVQALGPADWVRSGAVQQAVSDAAVRAAAATPALADMVRSEQDARNELITLRRRLSGDGEAAALPQDLAAQTRERISKLEALRQQLQGDIRSRFPDYDRLVRPSAPSAPQVAERLRSDQVLVLLLPTADAVYAWAVAADRPATFARVAMGQARLQELVMRLRRRLDLAQGATMGAAYDSNAAFMLYEQLLAPLRTVWQGKAEMVIAASGALGQLPFAVLHTRAGGGGDAQAPWLIKDTAITQVPSLSAWLAVRSLAATRPAAQAFSGWGDPAFGPPSASTTGPASTTPGRRAVIPEVRREPGADDGVTLPPAAMRYADIPALPDTREELLAIARALQADPQRDLLLGREATRDSVLAASRSGHLAQKRVIAFATHGLMAGDLPNLTQPALAMAATPASDRDPLAPLLLLEDVLSLQLNADWVVLSACNTAAAEGRGEEALSGMARGFLYAGARSLLVTHWAVETESARLLTTRTFEHYAAHPAAPKAESLRQAMLAVMATPGYGHPAFWAPYALVGDGGR